MSFSTLETLPDEILMLIVRYLDDPFDILQKFLGLNQRFNHIVLDRQLHALTDYLSLQPLDVYYDSDEFQQATNQLLSIKTSTDEKKLGEILQPLICYGFRQRYIEVTKHFQVLCEKFVSVRQTFSENERLQVDDQLNEEFDRIKDGTLTIESLKRIKELVLTRGAQIGSERHNWDSRNFASFVMNCCSCDSLHGSANESKLYWNLCSQTFEILSISNTRRLFDPFYLFYKHRGLESFLFYRLFGSRFDKGVKISEAMNSSQTQVLLNLLFLVIDHVLKMTNGQTRLLIEILDKLNRTYTKSNDFYIRTTQVELVKFVFEKCNVSDIVLSHFDNPIINVLANLSKEKRLDLIEPVFHHRFVKDLFQTKDNIVVWINQMLSTPNGRQVFESIMNYSTFTSIVPITQLFFIFLDKNERKFLEKLLNMFPNLINTLDEDGNDPLLYITLNTSEDHHRTIKLLLKYKFNLKRKNKHGQTFRDALQLPKNQKLLENLILCKIIDESNF